MNILFISCEFNLFDKTDCGGATRSTMFVNALSQLGHVDIISFTRESIVSNMPNCNIIYSNYIKSPTISGKSKMRLFFLLNPFSPLSYYQCDRKREKIVSDLYSLKQYDLVACRYIEEVISCGLLKYSNKLVVDVDDNLKKVFERESKRKDLSSLRRIELYAKSLFVGKMCRNVLKKVRCSFYSNMLEPTFKDSYFLHNAPLVREKLPVINEKFPKRILFIGWLDYYPNKYGILHFLEYVYPMIRKEVPDVEVYVVGKTRDNEIKKRLLSVSGVKYLGYVPDVVKEYMDCRLVIVPVYQGAGSSVKFIEGLFSNRPIVSTPMGARGFDKICQPNVHFMLAKNDKVFAIKTIELLCSVEKSNHMAKLAYEVGQQHFSQEKFDEIVKSALMSSNG